MMARCIDTGAELVGVVKPGYVAVSADLFTGLSIRERILALTALCKKHGVTAISVLPPIPQPLQDDETTQPLDDALTATGDEPELE